MVIEHFHYYVPQVLSEINKSLKPGGYLILTTPNIASLFRRLRLILGKQPIYRYHVREYTMPGRVEYVVKSIAERLAALGHETTVVTGDPKADKPREEEINGVHVIRWPTWAPSSAYHILRMISQLEKLLTDTARGADVVHAHSVHSISTTYAALALKATAKLVVTPHSHGTGHTACNRMDFSRGGT